MLAYQQTGLTGNHETRFRALIDSGTIRIQHVAIAFSYGRWLEQLSIQNVRAVLEYIERGENMTTRLAEVISLYLHHRKPIPIELIPVSKRVLVAAQTVTDGYGNLAYHCDQIALGIAKTDTAAAFTLLDEVLEQMNTAKPFRTYGTSNLFEGPVPGVSVVPAQFCPGAILQDCDEDRPLPVHPGFSREIGARLFSISKIIAK